MLEDNTKWQGFVQALETRGVGISWAWTAATHGGKRHNVGQVNFIGRGFQPAVLWAIVIDYNYKPSPRGKVQQHGFALCIDNGNRLIAAEADAIAGPNAPHVLKSNSLGGDNVVEA